ncbi:MAG TPA: hypothetical protein VGG68_09305 [Caulobacteraceae bacterium]|jgi:hypothetical protein
MPPTDPKSDDKTAATPSIGADSKPDPGKSDPKPDPKADPPDLIEQLTELDQLARAHGFSLADVLAKAARDQFGVALFEPPPPPPPKA